MNDRFKAYTITNRLNGKVYVGITSQTIDDRWELHVNAASNGARHGRFPFAIRKYGFEAFDVEHVASALSWADLCETEKVLIEQYGSFDPIRGYNATRGGEGALGVVWTEETKRIRVASYLRTLAEKGGCILKGVPKSTEHKENMRVSRRATLVSHPDLKDRMHKGAARSRSIIRKDSNSRGLTDEQVSFVRNQRAEGVLNRDLSAFHNVSKAAIENVCAGRTYKHVPMPAWSA